mmetsp:Transcript_36949/g.92668  ORF Transcript_36949/g.92668 Transcript_36949/m.92668 type:complete len:87 (-) Transcript_36949:631-891(-)
MAHELPGWNGPLQLIEQVVETVPCIINIVPIDDAIANFRTYRIGAVQKSTKQNTKPLPLQAHRPSRHSETFDRSEDKPLFRMHSIT